MFVIDINVPIICYGLKTDFQSKWFKGSSKLLEIAHKIEELKTICSCDSKAIFNTRKVNNKITFSGEQVAIDENTEVSYDSLCAKCYYDKLKKYQKMKESTLK